MQKITLVFGGSVGLYIGYLRVFDAIEKEFNCKLRRVSPDKITGRIGETEVECLFCINPIRDMNYNSSKEYLETVWKEVVPKPAEEIVKEVTSEKVLFFGLCGVFKGNKNEIYTPKEFHEVFFKDVYVKHKEILSIKPLNRISIKNVLSGKIGGKDAVAVTSNITLSYTTMEDKSKEHVVKMAKILSKDADIVDKETYQIAKGLNRKKLGIMLMSSDVLSEGELMLHEEGLNLNKEVFNSSVIRAIKTLLKP